MPRTPLAAIVVMSTSAVAGGAPTWDGAVGAPGVSGVVYALAVFDDGSGPALFVGGDFDAAGGVPANNLARWDGEQWSAVGDGVDGPVYALCVFDDGDGAALHIGGFFTSAGGQPASSLARWDGAEFEEVGGGVSAPQSSTDFAPPVRAMCVFDEDGAGPLAPGLVVAGNFSLAGAVPAGNLALLRGGQWKEIGGGLRHVADAVMAHDDGSGPALFVGGSVLLVSTHGGFTGLQARYIARHGADGWNLLNGGLNAQALAFAKLPNDQRLYTAGGFGASLSGVQLRSVGVWDGLAWSPMGAGVANGLCAAVFDLGFGAGRQLFVGGQFTMHTWDGAAWTPPQGFLGAPWYVRTMCVFDDGSGDGPALYIGGQFQGPGQNIAALRGQPLCPGDADGDGAVSFVDLNSVLGGYGANAMPGGLAGDVNYDGVADFADLNLVLSGFNQPCP